MTGMEPRTTRCARGDECFGRAPFVKGVATYCDKHEAERRARWNAIYGAAIARFAADWLAIAVDQPIPRPIDADVMNRMVDAAKGIADAVLGVDP